jgi:hypothetical protein
MMLSRFICLIKGCCVIVSSSIVSRDGKDTKDTFFSILILYTDGRLTGAEKNLDNIAQLSHTAHHTHHDRNTPSFVTQYMTVMVMLRS